MSVALLTVYLCFGRLNMALELAKHNAVYEDIASKFFEVSHSYRQIFKHAHLALALHLHCRCYDL